MALSIFENKLELLELSFVFDYGAEDGTFEFAEGGFWLIELGVGLLFVFAMVDGPPLLTFILFINFI